MVSFKLQCPAESGYSARIKDEEWERHREKLTHLHHQAVPRREILNILGREDSFNPSLPQLDARLRIWGLRRYDTTKGTPCTGPATGNPPKKRSSPTGDPLTKQILPYSEHTGDTDNSEDESLVLTPIGTPEKSNYQSTPLSLQYSSARRVSRDEEKPTEADSELCINSDESFTTDATSALSSSLSIIRSAKMQTAFPYALSTIQMPTDMATTDKLLRCVNDFASLMSSQRQKSHGIVIPRQGQATNKLQQDEVRRQQIKDCINATTEAYDNAHYYLKLGETSKAILKFQDAAPTVLPMFGETNLFLLTRLLEIGTWSSWKRFPRYESVVFHFLEHSAQQKLGPRHPLVVLLGCFAKAAAISKSYPTIWSCVIDHIDRMADNEISQAEAQRTRITVYIFLVRILRNNGNYSAAIQRCQELIQICITVNGLRSLSANRARYNLGVCYCEAGKPYAAIAAYEEARKYRGTVDAPYDGWIFSVFASSEIAQLYEQEGCIDQAGKYYEEAMLEFTRYGGDGSFGALLMLKDLLEFHERHGHKEASARAIDQYPAYYALLRDGRLDDGPQGSGRRQITTQMTRGKSSREWTWSLPIP
ncbi:hypothetical protein GGR58DRAFT_519713 [Xylaria digitata]|nr:hypothetical protein GGR58DRAFT_519713 [Xylaria digitata]